ncbi:MAG TPA: Tfp pilus assembly protein FimT/FimU [Wenzhouxiangellaceae bacterium]|nr:Tfp pilus assembly protein FimT/FimU [Wenzhouxiangellaceae bacterium]
MTNSTRFSPMRMRSEQAGFTLMELLIGIAVLAILTTLALPAFTQFIANNRLASEANEMVASFQFARSEALKRGIEVQVCSSADGATCGGNWAQGWIAMADPGGPDEAVLRVWSPSDDAFQFTPASSVVRFQPNGFSTAAAEQQIEMMLSGCTSDSARRILVERTGRVASQRVDCPT